MSVDLSQLHPVLVAKIGAVLQGMFDQHTPMKITDGYRTTAQQAALWAKGRTLPGKIVTQADGIHHLSEHQKGRALDCCFVGPEPYADSHPWGKYGELAKAQGLVWGGHWKHPDRPHVELPKEIV